MVIDHAYGNPDQTIKVKKETVEPIVVNTKQSYAWYDFSVRVQGMSDLNGGAPAGQRPESTPKAILLWVGNYLKEIDICCKKVPVLENCQYNPIQAQDSCAMKPITDFSD